MLFVCLFVYLHAVCKKLWLVFHTPLQRLDIAVVGNFLIEEEKNNKLASSADAIAISEIQKL